MLWAIVAKIPFTCELLSSLKPFHWAIPAPAEIPAKIIFPGGISKKGDFCFIKSITAAPSSNDEITPF